MKKETMEKLLQVFMVEKKHREKLEFFKAIFQNVAMEKDYMQVVISGNTKKTNQPFLLL